MKTLPVSIAVSDGTLLEGVLEEPDGASSGQVLFLHGLGETRDEDGDSRAGIPPFVQMSQDLTAHGLTCLRFDFRGHGASTGSFDEMTFAGLTADARASLEILRDRIDGGPIGLVCASFGSIAGLDVLATGDVKCGVLWNPLVDIRRSYVEPTLPRQVERFGPSGIGDRQRVELGGGRAFGKGILDEMRAHRMIDPSTIRVPFLVIHGTQDTYLPIEASRHLAERSPSGSFLALKGAEHGFGATSDRGVVVPATREFLLDHLTA